MTSILLVDDAISFHSMVEMFLRQSTVQRYKLLSVTSAEEMFRLLRDSEQIDVILLDISLPDMSGLVACREIRKINSDIPVIIITAKLDRNLAITANDAGATDFILKPFDGAALRSRIQHALSMVTI